jgi:hypothetical protein
MKTTVDIPDKILKEVIFYSRAKTLKSAIITAMEEYIRLRKSEKIAEQLGQFDNFFSASDLKKMRENK